MEKISIVTDSTCYLSEDFLKESRVKVVPLYVRFKEEVFKEGVEISHNDFYKRLRTGEVSSTSQPSPDDFLNAYKPLVEIGNSIISIHISSGISGTINSANIAKESLKDSDISIVDSQFTALGLGFLVMEAISLIKSGAKKDEILSILEEQKKKTNIFFLVKTLKYLHQGGRIGGAQALIGSMLQVKPILCFKDGKIDTYDKPRTMKAAYEKFLAITEETAKAEVKYLGILYGDNLEEGESIKKDIKGRVGVEPIMTQLGPVIGSHTGPELSGVVIVNK